MSKLRFTAALLLVVPACTFVFGARVAHAGSERITLTDGQATVYQATVSDVIPVTVTLSNGQPDYIDVTYWATDNNGNAVDVSPTSDRYYLTKNQSATDNIIVTGTGAALPVTFYVHAEGECASPDSEYISQVLQSIGAPGATAKAKTKAKNSVATPGTFTLGTLAHINGTQYTVPVTVQSLSVSGTPTGSISSATVTLQYSAVDSAGTPLNLPTVPKDQNIAILAGATINPTRSVLVQCNNDTSPPFFLKVTPQQATGTVTAVSYQLDTPNAATPQSYSVPVTVTTPTSSTTSTGTLVLTAGPSNLIDQLRIPVAFAPTSTGRITVYYKAQELDSNNRPTLVSHECIPSTTNHDAGAGVSFTDAVRIDCSGFSAGSTHPKVLFTAIAVDEVGVSTSASTSFTP